MTTAKARADAVDRYLSGEPVKAIAEKVGVSRQTIHQWLRGLDVPRRNSNRNRRVYVTLAPEHWVRLKEEADRRGVTVSMRARQLLVEALL